MRSKWSGGYGGVNRSGGLAYGDRAGTATLDSPTGIDLATGTCAVMPLRFLCFVI
jgi:hypothetical protein